MATTAKDDVPVEEALAFYGCIFRFTLRGREKGAAFIDMGDQFIALMQGPVRAERSHRHVGLVVGGAGVVPHAEPPVGVLADSCRPALVHGPDQ